MAMRYRATLAVLLLVIVTTSCSSSTDDGDVWCSLFRDVALAGEAFDFASDGSPAQATAATDLEEASLALAEAQAPDEIEADFDEVKKGPDVADAGDSFSEAAKRIGEWAIANCGYSPEMIEFLES